MRRRVALMLAMLTACSAAAADFRLLEIDGLELKWGVPELGAGAEVSYGFAAERASFPDARNCRELAPMQLLAAAWGEPARLDRIAAVAFGMWSRAADLRFRPVRGGERPDILIGAQGTPKHIAFANVWYDAAVARDGIAPLTRATICFNPQQPWAVGDVPGAIDLGTALAHEIGHAIGLDHPGASGALMGYDVQGSLEALLPSDAAGAVALYGPAPAD